MRDIVKIFDTTLRDGEQSPGASMNAAEKLRIATQLEKLGVDVIEAGFPAASEGDFYAVSQIARKITQCEVAGLCRTGRADIDRAWAAISGAAKPRIHTFIATSDIHLEYKLKMTREEVLAAAIEAVSYAKSLTDSTEFSAEDGSRSDRVFLCQVFNAVIDAGATVVNLPDTVGYAIPQEFAELVRYVMANVDGLQDGRAILSVHCHNDLGLATANTLAAIEAGARQAEVTINGIGERAGNTSMEEVVMAIKTRPNFFPMNTNIISEGISSISKLVSTITGIIVQPNKAIVGANAFAHEAGIHQDGVLKNPMTYEIMKPEDVGLEGNRLVLGKHSGRHGLRDRLDRMGHYLADEEFEAVNKQVKARGEGSHINDDELEAIIVTSTNGKSKKFKLSHLEVNAGTVEKKEAYVELLIYGQEKGAEAGGNGPVDAIFKAIQKITGIKICQKRFVISALSGGSDADAIVTARLECHGVTVLGRGVDGDILTASAKAYVDGLNRFEHLAENPKADGTEPVPKKAIVS